jgi:cysteine desulfurase
MAVYLDHNATTPMDPRVRDAMLPWMGQIWGNPSSIHGFGQAAREAVEEARSQVARLIGARPAEIVFTSSGTEANNAVLFDVARRAHGKGHVLVSEVEHSSVREAVARLEAESAIEVTRVPPRQDGVVASAAFRAALRDDTLVVCLMRANNELGTLQPVAEVGAACRERGIPLLCDAVQAVGKVEVDVEELGADYLSLGGHKFYGPLGAAALWVRRGRPMEGLLVGGGQERHRRASTENVPAIVGLGKAAELARLELEERRAHLLALRERFERGLAAVSGAVVHCGEAPRLPHTSHIALLGVDAQTLLIRLDLRGFAVSAGSACASGTPEPSKVLLAMGLPVDEARASVRVSFGPVNTADDVDAFLAALQEETAALRGAGVGAPLLL